MNVTCDICEATIEVPKPIRWKDWVRANGGSRDSQGRSLAQLSATWMVLAGGQWTWDWIVCGKPCWGIAAREHTPERMREAGHTLGEHVQFFFPEVGVLPDRMIERGTEGFNLFGGS